jgi:hypothetical protein
LARGWRAAATGLVSVGVVVIVPAEAGELVVRARLLSKVDVELLAVEDGALHARAGVLGGGAGVEADEAKTAFAAGDVHVTNFGAQRVGHSTPQRLAAHAFPKAVNF